MEMVGAADVGRREEETETADREVAVDLLLLFGIVD